MKNCQKIGRKEIDSATQASFTSPNLSAAGAELFLPCREGDGGKEKREKKKKSVLFKGFPDKTYLFIYFSER